MAEVEREKFMRDLLSELDKAREGSGRSREMLLLLAVMQLFDTDPKAADKVLRSVRSSVAIEQLFNRVKEQA